MKKPTYQGVFRLSRQALENLRERSDLDSLKNQNRFDNVEFFSFFIGYARSGHTAIASIIDGHPKATISNELDVFGFLETGFNRRQIFHMIDVNAKETAANGNVWTNYSYKIQGGQQGNTQNPLVIGDKKAGRTTFRLAGNPDLIQKLRDEIQMPFRVLHVVRNPFDHIAARIRHNPHKSISEMSEILFGKYDDVATIRSSFSGSEWLDLKMEDLISRPVETIGRIFRFLSLEVNPEFVASAAKMVMKDKSRRRDELKWSPEEIKAVNFQINSRDVLKGYSFKN